MRQEGYDYAERCANCGSDDIGSYWSSIEGHLCPDCATEYQKEKAARKVTRVADQDRLFLKQCGIGRAASQEGTE